MAYISTWMEAKKIRKSECPKRYSNGGTGYIYNLTVRSMFSLKVQVLRR